MSFYCHPCVALIFFRPGFDEELFFLESALWSKLVCFLSVLLICLFNSGCGLLHGTVRRVIAKPWASSSLSLPYFKPVLSFKCIDGFARFNAFTELERSRRSNNSTLHTKLNIPLPLSPHKQVHTVTKPGPAIPLFPRHFFCKRFLSYNPPSMTSSPTTGGGRGAGGGGRERSIRTLTEGGGESRESTK